MRKNNYTAKRSYSNFFESIADRYPLPTRDEISKRLRRFERDKECLKEKSLIELFQRYPQNTSREDELLKVSALRGFLEDECLCTERIGRFILTIPSFDQKLRNASNGIVDALAKLSHGQKTYTTFARYYCGCHYPKIYLMGAPRVMLALLAYNFRDDYMAGYCRYSPSRYFGYLNRFRAFCAFYDLEQYSILEIQLFLYQIGKDDELAYRRLLCNQRYIGAAKNLQLLSIVKEM